jgi:hypothetical protein
MTYYHGRSNQRPFTGKYIYLTSSLEYASLYSDSGFVFEVEVPFSMDLIFSIQNKDHASLLRKEFGISIWEKINSSGEIDWSELGYLCNNNFESGEDWLLSLGFKGMKLKERSNVDSLYIFDQSDVILGNKVPV